MTGTQLMIFTAIPQSIRLDPETAEVSVLVSPRLSGDARLGGYPDWLQWTERRRRSGLAITFECAGRTLTVDAPGAGLRQDLWEGLFNEETLVRPYEFDDYTARFVASYSVATAAALLKSTYQVAAVEFAAPEADDDPREGYQRRRSRFEQLVAGYRLQWTERTGRAWRDDQRWRQGDGRPRQSEPQRGEAVPLVPDSREFAAAQKDLVQQFGVFSHVPPGAAVSRASLDPANVLDFHQVLSSLNAYPALQRWLGLVFDLRLPLDFLAEADDGHPGELRVVAVDGHWEADTVTVVPVTSTAYVNASVEGRRVVAVAPLTFLETGRPLGPLGLLQLDSSRFGLAQFDVDGALHKTVMLADALTQSAGEARPPHPEVFDPTMVLSSLRSGGFTLFADGRALALRDTVAESAKLNDALEHNRPQHRPFCAEDLTRGYRLDVWDTLTRDWHSLHRTDTTFVIGSGATRVDVADEEGFFQLAATQAAPNSDGTREHDDLYLHEAMIRWGGWSLSAQMVGKHLTRAADPDHAVPDPAQPDPENEAVTPFPMTVARTIVPRSLPRLRFGVGYRLRVRVVDLAGNGLTLDDEPTALLTPGSSLPPAEGAVPYLRFEPIVAPTLVLRDERGVTGEGSSVDRLVIRTYNTDPSLDTAPADLTAADRHIAPPRTTVELAERHGMFDGPDGTLMATPAMWQLIKQRDESTFHLAALDSMVIDGEKLSVPLESTARIDPLPYLPDPLARAAALRDLPGTPAGTVGRVLPGTGPAQAVPYDSAAYQGVAGPRPRPGSVTIVEFGGRADWQEVRPFRLALADGNAPPHWDPGPAVLTVSLPKGQTQVVPLSSCCDPADLEYLGVWAWLREYVERVSVAAAKSEFHRRPAAKDRIAHVLGLAAEGGHGMLTPPHLVTLVHAVQQPLGRPGFSRLNAQFAHSRSGAVLTRFATTQPEAGPTAETELDPVTAWRPFGSTDAWLIGALAVHGPSTAKVDLRASWTDPVDDLTAAGPGEQTFSAPVDEVPLPTVDEGYLCADGGVRPVGFYDADHQLMCFGPEGAALGNLASGVVLEYDAAPRHRIGDTRHHVVSYTAVATSRYREYFAAQDGDFTRASDPVTVHVPASMRPIAPQVRYVVPTFGWEREARTNVVRSVRMGGGLRIYLDRPWYSSGVGELLGVALFKAEQLGGGPVDREEWKPFVTQWGQDPIWASAPLDDFPLAKHFPDAVAIEADVPLDVGSSSSRLVAVAGHDVAFDPDRRLWYCDLTVDPRSAAYAPFVRLALVRYQPYALVEAKLSRVVLADFAQLTPERAATVTADPYRRGALLVTVSGPAPHGPRAAGVEANQSTEITVSVQERDAAFVSDLGWSDASGFVVEQASVPPGPGSDFVLWTGRVRWLGDVGDLTTGRYRLLIQEYELLPSDGPPDGARQCRLVYAETVDIEAGLLTAPPAAAARTTIQA